MLAGDAESVVRPIGISRSVVQGKKMVSKHVGVALLAAMVSWGASAATSIGSFTASFVNTEDGRLRLDGFGRGSSLSLVPSLQPLVGAGPLSLVPSPQPLVGAGPVGTAPFFDTWNIDVSGVSPGLYSFSNMVVDAFGSTTFTSITFNSYDASGARNAILFDLNAAGTQAVGSGSFTVLETCPVVSCVWIDVAGTRAAGGLPAYGDGGLTFATAVPEPASAAMLLLGLAGLGVVARRRLGA